MASSNSPKIYAGMLKKEMLEIAGHLGLTGVSKLRKDELLKRIQAALRRSKSGGKDASKTTPSKTERPATKASRAKGSAAKSVKKATASGTPSRTGSGLSKTAKSAAGAAPSTEERPVGAAAKAGESAGAGHPRRPEDAPRPAADGELSEQSRVTAVKYGSRLPFPAEDLRQIDAPLPGLPDGYGEDRIVLLPRDPEWLYTYWDVRAETRDKVREAGGVHLGLRLYEQSEAGGEPLAEHWVHELSRSWYLRAPAPGQSYFVEIGYRDADGEWLAMLRSNVVSVPPAGPSSVVADQFVTIRFEDPLIGEDDGTGRPVPAPPPVTAGVEPTRGEPTMHEQAHAASISAGVTVAGSASGVSPGAPGPTSPTAGSPWGGSAALAASRGDEAAATARDFWLVAQAELILFGATEPSAKVTLGGSPLRLRPDGTFSVRLAFPDGLIETPIVAVAEDGEQRREVTMRFERFTTLGESERG